jgi:transcriptional regulator with PAS, ATPase and Fis domain
LFLTRLTPDGADAPELASDAIALLTRHSWPGNVRELRNVMERAMAYAPIPKLLRAEHLPIATH